MAARVGTVDPNYREARLERAQKKGGPNTDMFLGKTNRRRVKSGRRIARKIAHTNRERPATVKSLST